MVAGYHAGDITMQRAQKEAARWTDGGDGRGDSALITLSVTK